MRTPEQMEDFRQKIDLYLDNALSNEEVTAFESTANSHPEYSSLLERASEFRNLVKTKVKRSTCSQNLINTIKNNIKM